MGRPVCSRAKLISSSTASVPVTVGATLVIPRGARSTSLWGELYHRLGLEEAGDLHAVAVPCCRAGGAHLSGERAIGGRAPGGHVVGEGVAVDVVEQSVG